MTQKVIKVGSSIAVTIPSQAQKDLGIKAGDEVKTLTDPKTGRFIVQTKQPQVTVDKELLDWTNKFIEQYRLALEALAKK